MLIEARSSKGCGKRAVKGRAKREFGLRHLSGVWAGAGGIRQGRGEWPRRDCPRHCQGRPWTLDPRP
eukprot:2483041-Rhodomonas_salina.1